MNIMRSLAIAVIAVAPMAGLPAEPDSAGSAELRSSPSAPGMDLLKLVATVSEKTHKQFLVDPRVRGSVNMDSIEVRDVTYPVLLSILQIHGFAALADGDRIKIVPEANIRTMAPPLVSPDNIKGADAEIVSTIIPVNDGDAAAWVQVLRPLVPQYGLLVAIPDRNAILLTDRVSNVKRVISVIRAVEKLPEPKGR